MGKGSKRRPTLVDEETFEERWERTFGQYARAHMRAKIQEMKTWAQKTLAASNHDKETQDGS